jgi:hypothetical protein
LAGAWIVTLVMLILAVAWIGVAIPRADRLPQRPAAG